MSSQLLDIFLLALLAMFNPSLLAAVTVMLLLPNPKRLMVGYLLGAYLTSITLGLVIVFSLSGSSTESTSKHTVGPVEDIVIGLLAVTIAFVLRTGRDQPFQQRRRDKKDAKLKAKVEAGKPTESLPLRMLGKGDPKVTFVVGALLSFPGVSYLDALDHMHKLNPGTVPTVLLVIGFCLFQQILLEVPLLGYVFAPEGTQDTINRFKAWMGRKGRPAATIGAAVIGLYLVGRASSRCYDIPHGPAAAHHCSRTAERDPDADLRRCTCMPPCRRTGNERAFPFGAALRVAIQPDRKERQMCRWLAYSGSSILLKEVLYGGPNSLVDQSLHSRLGAEPTNGDGFGFGWYGAQPDPGVFHSIEPAWNDANLRELSGHISSPLFFTHIRAAIGSAVQQTNCHPFRHGNWLFMHNGYINEFAKIKRDLVLAVDPSLYPEIQGQADTEVLFHLALTLGLEDDPPAAVARAIGLVEQIAGNHDVPHPFQGTVATTDGESIWAFRYSSEHNSRSLFYTTDVPSLRKLYPDRQLFQEVSDNARLIVSEPLGDVAGVWNEVPESSWGVVSPDRVEMQPFVPVAPAASAPITA